MKTTPIVLAVFPLMTLVVLGQVTLVAPAPQLSSPPDQTQSPAPASQPILDDPQLTVTSDTGYVIADQGPHQRTWQRITEVIDKSGVSQMLTNSFVEIASGLNRLDEKGNWIPAEA